MDDLSSILSSAVAALTLLALAKRWVAALRKRWRQRRRILILQKLDDILELVGEHLATNQNIAIATQASVLAVRDDLKQLDRKVDDVRAGGGRLARGHRISPAGRPARRCQRHRKRYCLTREQLLSQAEATNSRWRRGTAAARNSAGA